MAMYPVQVQQSDDSLVLQTVPRVIHFTILTQFGYNPLLLCPCRASLELDYSRENGGFAVMTRKLAVFLDEHEGCEVT